MDVLEENGAVEEPTEPIEFETEEDSPIAEAEGYRFDFSKIHATDVKEFYNRRIRGKMVEPLVAILPAVENLEIEYELPGEIPLVIGRVVIDAFVKASRRYNVESASDIRFNVEAIQMQEAENWMVWAFTGNVEKQAELLEKYATARKKQYQDLLELDYETFLSVCAKFNDALLDLGKN